MRIVFMGTPDFAVGPLKALLDAKHDVCGVVTQPDKASSRGKVFFSPVKRFALENGLSLYQFEKIRFDGVEALKSLNPDVIVTAAYGQILSRDILDIPKYGVINVHASFLPEYRGSSPIQWAIINGERETGITIMKTDEGIDTGDVLMRSEPVEINESDTAESLFGKLAPVGSRTLLECLKKLEKGDIVPEKQDGTRATYYPILKKSDGRIDWSKSASSICRLIRGTYPWPGAFAALKEKTVKIHSAFVSCETGTPGEVKSVSKDGIAVCCGEGSITVTELQFEGKPRMSALDALNGRKIEKGDMFC